MLEQQGSLFIKGPGVGKLNDLQGPFELKFNRYDNMVLPFFSKFSSPLLFKTIFYRLFLTYVLD